MRRSACEPKSSICAGAPQMLAFANLGSQTSDLLPLGKAHLRESAQDGARGLETFLSEVERKAFTALSKIKWTS